MKITAFILGIILFIGPCDSNESVKATKDSRLADCFRVKTVATICGEAVVQIQNEQYMSLGEDWNGFNNVFFTSLPCGAESFGVEGKEFSVRILEKPDAGDCIRCKATIAYDGKRRYFIAASETCN